MVLIMTGGGGYKDSQTSLKKHHPIRLVFMDFHKNTDIKNTCIHLESQIQSLFHQENDPIHISNTYAQTISLASQVLHADSLSILNKIDSFKYKKTLHMIQHIKSSTPIETQQNFVIDSGGALSICGIRQTQHIDYIANMNIVELDTLSFCNRHTQKQAPYTQDINEIIHNPKYHFYMFGLKCINLRTLCHMKKNRNTLKDKKDIVLIKSFLRSGFISPVPIKNTCLFYTTLIMLRTTGILRRIKRYIKKIML